jgi:hypothetical protein
VVIQFGILKMSVLVLVGKNQTGTGSGIGSTLDLEQDKTLT